MASSISVPDALPEVTVNVVPCRIHYSGPAKTAEYFTPSKSNEVVGGRVQHIAQFRGLRLVGESIPIGDKKGYFVSKSELLVPAPEEESGFTTTNQYVAEAQFDELCVYGQDSLVALTSQWKLMSEWEAIAEVLHS